MKSFLAKAFVFSIPALVLFVVLVSMDIFKIFGFQEYYKNQRVAINRGMVTTKTYNHFREQEKYNSFIFGNSRSNAFKCKNWKLHLDDHAKPFHFDASAEGLWGVSKKIEYIDELGDTIENALVIIDRTLLKGNKPKEGHLYISMPCISKSSKMDFYGTFIKASLNPKFLYAYADYSFSKTYKESMGSFIKDFKYDHTVDTKTCDLWKGYDKEIKNDSIGYYKRLIEKNIFYSRPVPVKPEVKVTALEIEQLNKIKAIFNKHNTKYKVVISPVFDQVKMEEAQLELLREIFGVKNVHNFSGKNYYTEDISNFYEASHFRPHIGNEIMSDIYNQK